MKRIRLVFFLAILAVTALLDITQYMNEAGVFANKYYFLSLEVFWMAIGLLFGYMDILDKEKNNENNKNKKRR